MGLFGYSASAADRLLRRTVSQAWPGDEVRYVAGSEALRQATLRDARVVD